MGDDNGDDRMSTFSYDGDGEPDSFNLAELQSVVDHYFSTSCKLEKLAQGGYHKVYDILRVDGSPLDAVVRVASPAFPKDKLESEVATCKMIAAFTNIPVPRIYAWNSDVSNPVGAEYMILDKIRGTPASHNWGDLPEDVKKTVVSQVARYFLEIFSLRFESAGSLYLSPLSPQFLIGPIIRAPFYRALDGVVRVSDAPIPTIVDPNRGPFSTVTEYLSSNLRAELEFCSNHRSVVLSELHKYNPNRLAESPPELGDRVKLHKSDPTQLAESRLELGERVLRKAIELCSVYPGDILIPANITTPQKPFSLKLNDFRLSNIMIDPDSGRVTGFIDFEAATIAPLWECAVIPRWLQHVHDPESSYEGGTSKQRKVLRAVFLSAMEESARYPEWREAYDMGRPFRRLADLLHFQVNVWASNYQETWVDKRLEWAKTHPGIGFLDTGGLEFDLDEFDELEVETDDLQVDTP
ncbi:hypothetical protein CY34DRAFT_812902 [Suillus luteus UH-Slu-Lm8-n1]|uniref:Aminoglycoside phosphotransferase domain-containing protein n=1 Tax=Suillus luteus UH-Slu-Lm8-n1 TaxID=930992 RepID=A0A0C9ZAC5_9AGAM|nr:hypothetical protein CY34DRAFT_812902 [Suillus luteus UH-Slu-Lm8-n1]